MYQYKVDACGVDREIFRFPFELVDSNMYFIPSGDTGIVMDPNENDEGNNRLATQFRAFLRPNVTTGAPSYALPGDTEEGIEFINVDTFKPAGIYSIDGKRQNEFKKGMNVIILEDGTVQKVYVK